MPIVRHSKKRDAMLELMRSTTCHPTAEWLYRGMREIYPDISLGTVYRNLNQLCEDGLAQRVGVVDGNERFDGDVTPHAHFFCHGCSAVLDLPDHAPTQAYLKELSRENGFVVESHEFKLHGLCQTCIQKETIN